LASVATVAQGVAPSGLGNPCATRAFTATRRSPARATPMRVPGGAPRRGQEVQRMIPIGPLTTVEKAIVIVLGIDAAVAVCLPVVYYLHLRTVRRRVPMIPGYPPREPRE